jgi:hypothetical protein
MLSRRARQPKRVDSSAGRGRARSEISISERSYHGWPGALVVSNGIVEAVVVPSIGRVMQFHFVNEPEVFWENGEWLGARGAQGSEEWRNFGGDKSWPGPQADWPTFTGREWPPPAAFDAIPHAAEVWGDSIALVSALEPAYGIQIRRLITLVPNSTTMRTTTTYQKLTGGPVKVSIGVITQLREPERVFLYHRAGSKFAAGYVRQQFGVPSAIRREGTLVGMRSGVEAQIGSDADQLLWMDHRYTLCISCPKVPGGEYAERVANATVYTASAPPGYVELEPFGPLTTLRPDESTHLEVTYVLDRRRSDDPASEANQILG